MAWLTKVCILLLGVEVVLSTIEPLTKEEKAAKKKAQKVMIIL